MANELRTDKGSLGPSLQFSFAALTDLADRVKTRSQDALNKIQAGPIGRDELFKVLNIADDTIKQLDKVAAVDGLPEYASSQWPDPNPAYDLLSAIATTRAAVVALHADLRDNLPYSAGDWAEEKQKQGDRVEVGVFTQAQTAQLIPLFQAVIDSID